MRRIVEEIKRKHCNCRAADNRMLLEIISTCPDCQTFFSTLMFHIPEERLVEVIDRIVDLMEEMGVRPAGKSVEDIRVMV